MLSIFDFIGDKEKSEKNSLDKNENNLKKEKNSEFEPKLFSIEKFIENLKFSSAKNNFIRFIHSNLITAYDVAFTCIRQVVYRLFNYPIKSYEDIWLPIAMRQIIGKSIHEFIQTYYDFEQIEVAIKIDKFNFSGRVDAINGNNVLIEIKSVSFSDYEKIISSNKPRTKDLKQALVYKHLLENHIDKINLTKNNLGNDAKKYNWPKYENYKFKYIQFIYIAHDLISADAYSVQESLILLKSLKRQLNSKNNKFFFIKDVIVDVDKNKDEITKIEKELFDKLLKINYYIEKNKLPDFTDKYIDNSNCFFCPYKEICTKN